jgi:phosphate butyryltransferase
MTGNGQKTFRHLSEILEIAKVQTSKKLVVAAAEDLHVLQAVLYAQAENIINPILVGDSEKILELCRKNDLEPVDIPLIDEKNPERSCELAVDLIRKGEASILMKGLVPTAPLLKAVLDKDNGLRKNKLLSHAAIFEVPTYHKLVAITDAAMNVQPDLEEKAGIIENAVEMFHRIGLKEPKVGVLAPIETVNPKIQSTVDARDLKAMNLSGRIKGCLVDGPFAMDNAVSGEAALLKGIKSQVAGDVDILLAPDLNSGNILYKTLIFLANSISAAVVMGASVPIVLTSRADSEQSKLMSIALAAVLG